MKISIKKNYFIDKNSQFCNGFLQNINNTVFRWVLIDNK